MPAHLTQVSKSPLGEKLYNITNKDTSLLKYLPEKLLKRDPESGNIIGIRVPTITDAMLYQQPGTGFKDPKDPGAGRVPFNPLIHFIPRNMHLFNDDDGNLLSQYSSEFYTPSSAKMKDNAIKKQKDFTVRQIQNADAVTGVQELESDTNKLKEYQATHRIKKG